MKIDPQISLDDFKSEMQHRVVRYSLRSLPVQQALRFARQHKDPEFFRVASNKIHAQRQFQREMYGPGWFERVFDYLSFGSLREVVMTVLLVGLGVLGIDAGKRAMQSFYPPNGTELIDVNRLALGLGYSLNEDNGPMGSVTRSQLPTVRPRDSVFGTPSLSEEDVQRIAKALLKEMQAREQPPAVQPAANNLGQNASGQDGQNTVPQVSSNEGTILAGRTP